MKINNPKRYRIEGNGEWGISEGQIFTNWETQNFDKNKMFENREYKLFCGLDFGYRDETAFISVLYKQGTYELYIVDELCSSMMSNVAIFTNIANLGYKNSKINADSEDPRTINELKTLGLYGIVGAKKPKGSVLAGIQKLQDYKIIIHKDCKETIIAFENYVWKKNARTNKTINEPEHEFSHIPDALRYATYELKKKNFKFI